MWFVCLLSSCLTYNEVDGSLVFLLINGSNEAFIRAVKVNAFFEYLVNWKNWIQALWLEWLSDQAD